MSVDVHVAEAASELYALPLTEFRAARDLRAAHARTAGQKDIAADIKKLARPTVSAWLVNRLARDAAGALGELLDLGKALREAQHLLAGERLRELSRRRRQLMAALITDARRLAAEHSVLFSPQVLREVHGTLVAALAVPDVAQAVRSGRLTKPMSYSGLGSLDLRAMRAVRAAALDDRVADLERQLCEVEEQLARARAEREGMTRDLAASELAGRALSGLRRDDEGPDDEGPDDDEEQRARPRLRLVPPLAD